MEEFLPEMIEPNAFDMSISTLVRINYWLWKTNEAYSKYDVDTWINCLRILQKEIIPFLKDKEREEFKELARVGEAAQASWVRFHNSNNLARAKTALNPPRQIFESLDDWETKLRIMLDKKGLLMKKGEDARNAMLRMN